MTERPCSSVWFSAFYHAVQPPSTASAEPVEHCFRCKPLRELRIAGLNLGTGKGAGHQCVDANAFRTQFGCEMARELDQGCFRGAVVKGACLFGFGVDA